MMSKILAVGLLMIIAVQTQAQANSAAFVSIPSLDEMGLIGLTIVVAIAGAFAARRRKK